MKNLLLSFLVLSICLQLAQAQEIHSIKLAGPVVIDGSPEDWPQPFNFYNGETKLQYRIANDTTNIYVCFKVTDETAQMKMMRAGINVWLDPKGKRKETTGVGYPMKQERVQGSEGDIQTENKAHVPGQTYQKHDFNRFKGMAKASQIDLRLKGFADIPDQVISIKNTTGIVAALNWDSLNILCIEYQIPIAKVLKHPFTAADTLQPIGIGFVVNALQGANEPRRSDDDNSTDMTGSNFNRGGAGSMNTNMTGMNQGMGGMNNPAYGTGTSPAGPGNSNYNEAAQERKVWSKLILNWE